MTEICFDVRVPGNHNKVRSKKPCGFVSVELCAEQMRTIGFCAKSSFVTSFVQLSAANVRMTLLHKNLRTRKLPVMVRAGRNTSKLHSVALNTVHVERVA